MNLEVRNGSMLQKLIQEPLYLNPGLSTQPNL